MKKGLGEHTMDDSTKKMTRREALRAGAGALGTPAALSSGALPAVAQRSALSTFSSVADDSEWNTVADVFGVKGMIEPGDVLLIQLDRSDLHPTLSGISVDPSIGFDTEITFQHLDQGAMVKWEMCLRDSEVNPVLDSLFHQNLRPAPTNCNAIHNHFLDEEPDVKFLHGTALGDAVGIAKALRAALEHSGQPFESSPPQNTGLPNQQIEEILGGMGMISGPVLTVDVEREETFRELGVELKPAMQVESMFNFQSLGNGQAAMVAELVVLPEEADAAGRTLRSYGIYVTALHNHELFIKPTIYYLHAFGTADPLALAKAARAALNHTKSKFM
jgi:hypothetical protein